MKYANTWLQSIGYGGKVVNSFYSGTSLVSVIKASASTSLHDTIPTADSDALLNA
jgi:hypothetical protein